MIKKVMFAIVLIGLMIAISSCGGNTTAPAGPPTTTSPARTTSTPASSPRAEVTVTGKWELAGKEGARKGTVDMVGMDGHTWSGEADGSLWKTDKSGNDTLIDKGGFKGITQLTTMGGKLYTIEEGTLYQTDPNTLKWEQIGKEGDFANINVMEGVNSAIYMIDKAGNLYK